MRHIPTAIETDRNEDDISLLQYAYSDSNFRSEFTAGALARTFAYVYGMKISSESLQHAFLAVAFSRPETLAGSVDEHVSRVYRHLIKKPDRTMNEGDLFAVYLLGMLGALRCRPNEFTCHLQGFASILKLLRNNNDASAELLMF